MLRKIIISLSLLLGLTVSAQTANPIKWDNQVKMSSPTEGILILKAKPDPGWHLYGMEMPEFGPKATEINLSESKGVVFTGKPIPSREPLQVHDNMFDVDLNWWDSEVEISIPFTLAESSEGSPSIKGTVLYMGCNDQTCSPPQTYVFSRTALQYDDKEVKED